MQYKRFAKIYDTLMRDVDYDCWAEYLCNIAERYCVPLNFVVDCACGTGAMSIRLAKRGSRVIGIDLSEEMLQMAQENSRESGVSIVFAKMDMRSFTVHKPADAVIAVCDGVNYLTSMRDVKRFFESAYRALKPNGLLMFDISSHYKLKDILGDNTFAEDTGEIAYIWQNSYDSQSKLIEMNLSFFEKTENGLYERFTERHIQRAHSEQELKNALCSIGFNEIYSYEAFSFIAPSNNSERIQFVAKR